MSKRPKFCWPIKMEDSLKCNISRKNWMMKFIFGKEINIEVFYKFMLSFWVCVVRHAQITQSKKFAYLWNISRKAWGIKTKVFYKLMVSNWMSLARHVQNTQNQFTRSLQYLKENRKDKVNFLCADKQQRFLRIDTIILKVH